MIRGHEPQCSGRYGVAPIHGTEEHGADSDGGQIQRRIKIPDACLGAIQQPTHIKLP